MSDQAPFNLLLLTGSRAFDDAPWMERGIRRSLSRILVGVDLLVRGDARGIDRIGGDIAEACGVTQRVWKTHGDLAGFVVRGTDRTDRWAPEGEERNHILRDRMMAEWCAEHARPQHIRYGCLGIQAEWSKTRGTLYTFNHAVACGYCFGILVDIPLKERAR